MKFGIGQPVRRREDTRFVTGSGRYLDDVKLSGEVHAAFVRSPHAHARVLGVDASAAGEAPGCWASSSAGGGSRHRAVFPFAAPSKNRDGSDIKQSPKALLPNDKVRFPGERWQ